VVVLVTTEVLVNVAVVVAEAALDTVLVATAFPSAPLYATGCAGARTVE
jgi:hypothetical protein